MTFNQWITYCLAVFAGGIIPGPIMLLAMTAGARHGVVSALPAAMGNVLASIVQVLVSIALVGAIAQAFDAVFRAMMGFGGLYLIYLGISVYRANPFKYMEATSEKSSQVFRKDFVDVFVITLLNPKAIMFFIALFPQVIPRDHYSVTLIAIMTAAFSVIALLCFVIYAYFGAIIRRVAGNSTLSNVTSHLIAGLFVVMGFLSIFNAVTEA